MANNNWESFRKRDADVISSFEKIAEVMGWQASAKLSIQVAEGHNLRLEVNLSGARTNSDLSKLLDMGSASAHLLSLQAGHPSIQIRRTKDRSMDSVTVHFEDSMAIPKLLDLLSTIEKELPRVNAAESIEKILGPEVAQFYRVRDAALIKLESTAQKLIEETASYRLSLDEQASRKDQERVALLQSQRIELETEYQSKQSTLKTLSDDLEVRAKDLDDKDSRHARRALRQGLQSELKQRSKQFSLTVGTNRKRSAIHFLFVGLIVIGIGFIGISVADAWDEELTPYVLARMLGGTVGLLTTCVFYFRWMDQWFRQHADEEFRLKRMELDIDRSSLVVETALEWQQQSDTPIPPQLLEQLSRGLFESGGKQTAIRHPTEDLAAAILSASSTLKVNLPGVGEATLNRKGVRQLNDALDTE